MAEQYTSVVVTSVPHGRAVPEPAADFEMIEAQFTPPPGQTFERSHVCATCGFTFKESEMSEIDGKWYCLRYHHAEDPS